MAVGIGLHFKIVDKAKFLQATFADICVAHGASSLMAERLAQKVATAGEAKTTVRPTVNLSHLRNDIAVLGTIVLQIAGRRC